MNPRLQIGLTAWMLACGGFILHELTRPILQPVVYLDEGYERMILGPQTRSPEKAREWAVGVTKKRNASDYMILSGLKWDREYDMVFAAQKFR